MEAAKLPIRQAVVREVDLCFDKPFVRWFLLPIMKIQYKSMKEPEATGLEGQRDCITGYDSLGRLPSIKAPTLVIAGTKDRIVKPTSSETIARNIPNARLIKIDKGSHGALWEMRKTFNKEVLNFLKSG